MVPQHHGLASLQSWLVKKFKSRTEFWHLKVPHIMVTHKQWNLIQNTWNTKPSSFFCLCWFIPSGNIPMIEQGASLMDVIVDWVNQSMMHHDLKVEIERCQPRVSGVSKLDRKSKMHDHLLQCRASESIEDHHMTSKREPWKSKMYDHLSQCRASEEISY